VEINPISFFQVREKKSRTTTRRRKCNKGVTSKLTQPQLLLSLPLVEICTKVGFPFCHRFSSDISYLLQIKSDATKFAKTFIPSKNIDNKERKKERSGTKVLIENQRCVQVLNFLGARLMG